MVSVIMAVYNTEKYLSDAVNSVLAQTYSNWELLAIDDGSTDSSGEILDRMAKQDARIRVFHTENGGLSAARNIGLKNMKGDYIQFLDSDDWLEQSTLEDCVSTLDRQKTDMVVFDAFYTGEGTCYHKISALPQGVYDSKMILEKLSVPLMPPFAWNKFCISALYKDIFFPEGELWEDVATTFYPVSRARRISILPKPLYYYRQRPDAITKMAMKDDSIYQWRFRQYRKRYDFLKQNYPDIAEAAKTAVVTNGLLYYACFRNSLQGSSRRELYTYITSSEFDSGITDIKIGAVRQSFKLFPWITSTLIKAIKHLEI